MTQNKDLTDTQEQRDPNSPTIKGGGDLLAENPGGRIIHFGVREHAMASILNGMALHGGVRPFAGTLSGDYSKNFVHVLSLNANWQF